MDQSPEEVAAAEVSRGVSVAVGGRVATVWWGELEGAVWSVLVVVAAAHA
jgi:hypothetical protein